MEQLQPIVLKKIILIILSKLTIRKTILANLGQTGFYWKSQTAKKTLVDTFLQGDISRAGC